MTPLYISRQKIFQKFKRQARCRFWMTSKASEAEFSKSNSDKKQKSVNWKTKRRGKFWKSKNKWNRCEITTCTVVIMTFFKNTASPPSTGHQATQPKDKRPSSWMTVAPIKNGNFRRSSHFWLVVLDRLYIIQPEKPFRLWNLPPCVGVSSYACEVGPRQNHRLCSLKGCPAHCYYIQGCQK